MASNDSENKQKLENIVSILRDATIEPFTNNLEFNNSCLLITIFFLLLFVYKKEVIKFFN